MSLLKHIPKAILESFWIIPVITVIAVSFFSYANVDSIRDYTEALRIARGENYPLLGPQMSFTFSVGPWWFYLMSLLVWIDNNWMLIAVFTAILSSIKFYMAYRLGLLLADRTLGVMMVSTLMLISMNLMQSITFTHTNLVETIMLVILFVCLKNHQNLARYWLLLGILSATAFHVHPTAFLIGYFVAILWFTQNNKIRNALLFITGFLLIFMPLIYYEFAGNENLVTGSGSYLKKNITMPSLVDFGQLLLGFWIFAPYAMLKAIIGESWATIVIVVQVALQILAWTAPLWTAKSEQGKLLSLLKHLWIFFILTAVGMLLIRSNTPWYFSYSLGLTSALITAIGLYFLCQNSAWKNTLKIMVLWLFVVFLGVQLQVTNLLNSNRIAVPSKALNDIKSLDTTVSGLSYEIVAHQAKNHGEFTCQKTPVALHGAYAQLIYSHSGMEHHSVCDTGLFYGPADVERHLLGVPNYFAKYIAQEPMNQVGNTFFYSPISYSMNQTVWAEDFKHDYERKVALKTDWQQPIRTKLTGGKNLVVTNLLAFKMPWKVNQVKVNGTIIDVTVAHYYSALYVCNQCSEQSNIWEIEYQEGVIGMTNIASF